MNAAIAETATPPCGGRLPDGLVRFDIGHADYAAAIRLGLGWGMLPRQQYDDLVTPGQLVVLDPARHVDVTLYWQQWSLRTPALDAIAEAITRAARTELE